MSLTEDKISKLNCYGIKSKFHNKSILDYPEIEKWMKSEKGELFLSGQKDLILLGGWQAIKIGILIQRWFILAGYLGAVIDLVELSELLKDHYKLDYEDQDPRIDCRSIFIQDFQNEDKFPLDPSGKYRVLNYLQKRVTDEFYTNTVLHVFDKELPWYSETTKEFINDCFMWIDCREQRS